MPAEAYFKNFQSVDASKIAQMNAEFVRAQDRRLDQQVKLAQSLESDKLQHEMQLVD